MSEAADRPSSRRFSISHLVLLVPWVAVVIAAWKPIRDNSFLWHVRAGGLQMERGEVLTEDPFSFTMQGEPWLTQSWLAELLYGWSENLADLGFVPPLILIAGSVTLVGVGLIAHRNSNSVSAAALVVLLSTGVLLTFLVPRPVIISFALFVLAILAWGHPGSRWALPFIFWVWASVHGSFVIGLVYVGLTLIVEREWRWLPSAFVAGVITLTTAHGIGVVAMLIDFAQAGDALEFLTEWRRPDFVSLGFLPFAAGIGLLLVGSGRRLVGPRHLIVIVPFLALGLTATRAVPPAWIALVPLVSTSVRGLSVGLRERLSVSSAAIFGLVVLTVPFLLNDDGAIDEDRFPVVASRALESVPTFHDDIAGGYLIWEAWPKHLVFIDDRAELYQERIEEYVRVREGEMAYQSVFERDGIKQVLLRADEPLVDSLVDDGWRQIHRDENFVVMVS